jgi:uncharacterized membrane-anchored protein YitT (DUF2179 family)
MVNIPFIFRGYRILGKKFNIKTTIVNVRLTLVVEAVTFLDVTKDNLLVAIFGAFSLF